MAGHPSGDLSRSSASGKGERQQEHPTPEPGRDPREELREPTARQRAHDARLEHETPESRLHAAALRDEVAETRDLHARARDAIAEERNIAMAQLDDDCRRDENRGPLHGADVVIRAAGQRRRTEQRREQAAQQRELSAQDRTAAARDRERAADERREALADREALLEEIRREQRRCDEALARQHRAEDVAGTLRRSLSPPRLPRVAGLDVAAHYEPFAPEEVGGDFYDLFPLGPGRSVFFLGDVCGKGPAAATLTSLARYALRTAAMLGERPEAILTGLNIALRADSAAPMQTCTVVCGQIDHDTAGARVALAAAGHPAPLVVRADGAVETTDAQGTLLGAVDDPRFHTCEVGLAPGDAILVYSDGILDAEIGGVRMDERRLAGMLEGRPGTDARGLLDRLVQALERIDRPLRDDVALMVLRREA